MKYLLLIYESEASFAGMSGAEQARIFEEYMDYTKGIRKSGNYIGGAKDLDEAIKLAAGIPASRTGSIEVRPIMPTPPIE